jgi:hypothetical protein
MIRRISPFTLVSSCHPLFVLESRRVRRLLNRPQLIQMSFRVLAVIFCIAFIFWLLAVNEDNRRFNQYQEGVSQLLALLFAVSIGLDGILDFACMVATANSFAGEFVAGRWDLLRLTPYSVEDFAAVKHAAARLRVWRMTVAVFSLRLTVVVLGVFTWLVNDGLRYLQIQPVLAYLALVLLGAAYLLDPFWRAEMVTLLGLGISIRLRNGLSLTLAAIGSVLALWILQPLVIGFIFWCSGSLVGRILFSVPTPDLGYAVVLLISVYIIIVFYGFYAVLRKNTYSRLLRWIDRAEA